MANDLANEFVGAAIIAFRSAFVALQGEGAAVGESLAKLEIALFAEAEFLSGAQRPQVQALAFEEHGQFAGDFIVCGDAQGTSGPDELLKLEIELKHGKTPKSPGRSRDAAMNDSCRGDKSLIKYGGPIAMLWPLSRENTA